MKKFRITIDVYFEESDKYNPSEEERNIAIKEMQDTMRQEFIYKNVIDIYSSVISSEVTDEQYKEEDI